MIARFLSGQKAAYANKRVVCALAVLGGVWCGFLPDAHAQQVSIKELLDTPARYAHRMVEVRGEAVGEPLYEKEAAWININSDGYAIGLFVPKALVGAIAVWGDFRHRGDIISVRGVFYAVCPHHFERDVHVVSIQNIEPGFVVVERIAHEKVNALFVLLIICLTTSVVYLIKVKKPEAKKYGT